MEHNFLSAPFIICNRTFAWECDTQAWHCDGGTYTAVTSSKFLNQCFTDAPDDIKSYVSKDILHLLQLNITAGRPRWIHSTNHLQQRWLTRGKKLKLVVVVVVSFGVTMEAEAGMTIHSQRWGHFWPNAQPRVCARVSVCMVGLDRYRYRVSADTCEYRWVSVSADTYFSIGADTNSSFTCLNSQHCCTHTYSFKLIVCFIVRNTLLQCCRQQPVCRSSWR